MIRQIAKTGIHTNQLVLGMGNVGPKLSQLWQFDAMAIGPIRSTVVSNNGPPNFFLNRKLRAIISSSQTLRSANALAHKKDFLVNFEEIKLVKNKDFI